MRGAHRALDFIMDQYFSAVQQAAERSNQFNAQQAQMSREWQAMMSNTAHQREVADLKAAGLNPVLSANSGASAPSGAQASANDTSGAIAGLLGQMINAQSAQAIANKQIASAQLLETMKEDHDRYIHENFPNNLPSAIAAALNILTNPKNSVRGSGSRFYTSQVTNPNSALGKFVGFFQNFGSAWDRFWTYGTDQGRAKKDQENAQKAYDSWRKPWM